MFGIVDMGFGSDSEWISVDVELYLRRMRRERGKRAKREVVRSIVYLILGTSQTKTFIM